MTESFLSRWLCCLLRGHLFVTFATVHRHDRRTTLARCIGCDKIRTWKERAP